MANFGPLTATKQIGAPQQILTDFSSWLRYCSDVTHLRPTKLCTIFGHLLGWYTIYTFWGLLPPDRILPRAKFTLCPSLALRSRILAALLHGTPAAGHSQTLRHDTKNGITELSQRAPPIFGWAAITLGIGSHSSAYYYYYYYYYYYDIHLMDFYPGQPW